MLSGCQSNYSIPTRTIAVTGLPLESTNLLENPESTTEFLETTITKESSERFSLSTPHTKFNINFTNKNTYTFTNQVPDFFVHANKASIYL